MISLEKVLRLKEILPIFSRYYGTHIRNVRKMCIQLWDVIP